MMLRWHLSRLRRVLRGLLGLQERGWQPSAHPRGADGQFLVVGIETANPDAVIRGVSYDGHEMKLLGLSALGESPRRAQSRFAMQVNLLT